LKIITGDPTEVFQFIRSEQSVLDFNQILPMPEHLKTSDEEVALDGSNMPAWYAWAVENWGTKWNARDAQYSTKDPQHVIWFDTAWSPPVAVFEALAKQFPAHEIVVYSDEYGNHMHATFILKDGGVKGTFDACQCFDG
jgi:hypothetical protein